MFFNCPFDEPFRPLLYALVFAVHDCGFKARSTLEIDDAGRVRIENLYDLIIAEVYKTDPEFVAPRRVYEGLRRAASDLLL
ncbi:MAG TPA: hypothetical protein VFX77_10420 [Rubrobacter sp.]|nr:hypothetical protein [Rubrobacter sp.]